jgi:hypothetical protein
MRYTVIGLILLLLVLVVLLTFRSMNQPSILDPHATVSQMATQQSDLLKQPKHQDAPTTAEGLTDYLNRTQDSLDLISFLSLVFKLSEFSAPQALGFLKVRIDSGKGKPDELSALIGFPARFKDQEKVRDFAITLLADPGFQTSRLGIDRATELYLRACRNTNHGGEELIDIALAIQDPSLQDSVLKRYALFQKSLSPKSEKKMKDQGVDPSRYWPKMNR